MTCSLSSFVLFTFILSLHPCSSGSIEMGERSAFINVFTLNVWGIPYVSKDRHARINAIASYLAEGRHDIVCLQEVWDTKDFALIAEKAKPVLPYSHYFYSGVFGSGVCILSKWPIEEVFFHAWPLNGYVHMIHHGDWFGGKGVGLCKIRYNDLVLNVYSAHLHAEYSTEDIYLAHRILQAFNTAEFIKMTSSSADVIILAGDLNTQPNDLAFRIILNTGILIDTCTAIEWAPNENDEEKAQHRVIAGTNERACNSYSDPAEGARQPEGKRIDYILYHTGQNHYAKVKDYSLPLSGRVPGCSFSYSDHDAVAAQIEIMKSAKPHLPRSPPKEYVATLGSAILICGEALATLQYSAKKYSAVALSLFILLVCTVGMADRTVADFPRLLLVVVMFYCVFMATLWNYMERNGIVAGMQAMEVTNRYLAQKHKIVYE